MVYKALSQNKYMGFMFCITFNNEFCWISTLISMSFFTAFTPIIASLCDETENISINYVICRKSLYFSIQKCYTLKVSFMENK